MQLTEWTEIQILGNGLIAWGSAALIFLLALGVGLGLRRVVETRLAALVARTQTGIDDLLLAVVRGTSRLFLLILALFVAFAVLDLPPGGEVLAQRVFAIALFVQGGLWARRALRALLPRFLASEEAEGHSQRALGGLFSFFGQLTVWSVVVLLTLDNLGFDVTTLIAGLGIGGVAVALALQNVLGDTFAALSIALDRPFEVDDFVVIGDFAGTVEKIGVKTTRLRSLSGEQLVFGNQDLLSSRIRNYKRMKERRVVFSFGVVYATLAEKLAEIPVLVREIIEGLETTRFDRAHLARLGESSIDFEVVYYVPIPDYKVYMDLQQQIYLELLEGLEKRGIDLAFPTRTVVIEGNAGAPAAS